VQRMDDDLRLLRRQFEEAQRRGAPPPLDADLCFVLIDIDHFKRVNDTQGHAAGDAVLVQMRERLQQVFRESDYLVRWGGEEFLVVARGTSRDGLPELAERVRAAVAQAPFLLPPSHAASDTSPRPATRLAVPITCSIGFACFPLDRSQPRTEHWSEALALADAALYAAKREGRNRWVGVQSAQGAPVSYLIASLNAGLHDPRMVVVRPHA
jgi:diguanylate cyclase (GGDEF)-like protein